MKKEEILLRMRNAARQPVSGENIPRLQQLAMTLAACLPTLVQRWDFVRNWDVLIPTSVSAIRWHSDITPGTWAWGSLPAGTQRVRAVDTMGWRTVRWWQNRENGITNTCGTCWYN